MPRYPVLSPLPPLMEALGVFGGLDPERSKTEQIAGSLREVARENRAAENQPFYTTREIATFFGVSQQTATFAVGRLEHEGLLQRIRGSQTVLLGRHATKRLAPRAVVVFPVEFREFRFSYLHGRLSRELADNLWRHHVWVEVLPYVEPGKDPITLGERILRQRFDFAFWLTPRPEQRELRRTLEDRGIRNFIVSFDADQEVKESTVVIDLLAGCRSQFLAWWERGIRRIHLPHSVEFPRRRLLVIAELAQKMGFAVEIHATGPELARTLLRKERGKARAAILLADENASAEFVFYDPESFRRLVDHHSILFACNWLNIPFAGDGERFIDRISADHPRLLQTIAGTLNHWCSGDFGTPIRHIPVDVSSHAPILRWF